MSATPTSLEPGGHDKAARASHNERREKLLALTHRIRIGLKDINSRNRPVQDFISDESTRFLGLEADLPETADGEQRAIEQETGFARSIKARRRAMRQRQDERPTYFKDISAHRLFLIRINHEKRLQEYKARVAEEIQRQGATNAGQKWRVACQVRSEFGYIKNMERVKFMERVMRESESMRGVHGEGALAEVDARKRAIKSSRAFEAAVAYRVFPNDFFTITQKSEQVQHVRGNLLVHPETGEIDFDRCANGEFRLWVPLDRA